MDRRFHHRITAGSMAGIVLLLLLSLYLFWNRSAVAGFLAVMVLVVVMERVFNSSYEFTADRLVIRRGRFARTLEVKLGEVVECRRMRVTFGLSHYLLISYGAGRMVSLQPADEEAFIRELKQRLSGR